MYIPIILGSAREGRNSEKAANYMLQQVQKLEDVETEILDVRDFQPDVTTRNAEIEMVKRFQEKMEKADAVIAITPEYNHSFSGELKMTLDMAYKEYQRKPIGICGVSAGSFGGVRAVEQLRLVAIEYHMVPLREAVYFTNIMKLFDENGNITDSSFEERLPAFFDELLWFAKVLKHGRENADSHVLCTPVSA